jgi:hypothetical protein
VANTRKSLLTIAFAVALLVCAGFLVLRLWKTSSKPLRDGPLIAYPATELSPLARQQFLQGDFKIIKNVDKLPRPVLQAFTEKGGSRVLMANPGRRFLDTDVIDDSSLPQKRLIFAGVLGDKCFVHYEQGGYARINVLAFFRLTSGESMEPLWRSYCGPAASIQDLRSQVLKGQCADPVPQRMR